MARIEVNSPGWERQSPSRGSAAPEAALLPGLPDEFLTAASTVDEEVVIQPRPTRDGVPPAAAVDLSYELGPGETAVLVVRRPSGALTIHAPDETVRRTRGGPATVRFRVPAAPPSSTSRGIVSQAMKAIVVKVKDAVVDAAVAATLPILAKGLETLLWKQKGLQEGWLKVTQETLKAKELPTGTPSSTERSLLFVHGTFSNAAAAFASLADTDFFKQVAPIYGDRIFAFDHFTLSRTPEDNARMLLGGLPKKQFTFDVITHSRGGLVLRNLVERAKSFDDLSDRFRVGRVVLVASPNEGTPLATPRRFEDTIGWIANLLEVLPDHPFTTGPAFVANGIVWLARHLTGDLPGLASMNGDGETIRTLQGPPGPPPDSYSALVANCNPTGKLTRLLDIGLDQFFGSANDLVVPSEGGWRIDRSGSAFIPGTRIGCFGQGGNLPGDSVTHVNIFAQAAATPFLVKALEAKTQPLTPVDPAVSLPDRRLLRAGAAGVAAPAVTPGMIPIAGARARITGTRPVPVAPEPSAAQFSIEIVNGDLSFESLPLLVGHYRATQLTGTEAFIDKVTRRALSRSLDLGVYPVEPGSHQIFVNTFLDPNREALMPRPEAVIVVGMGQEGDMRPADLTNSIRRAVLAWAQRVAEKDDKIATLSLASTLMGSGGHGITVANAAVLIAQGIYEANQLLVKKGTTLPSIAKLRLIELYTDRASEAWRALRLQAEATPGRFAVVEPITQGTGPLLRPVESGYRGADYDFIQATTRTDPDNQPQIEYALDTRRGRTEVRAQVTQVRLIRNLVAEASSGQSLDPQIGSTLYKLLIPVELEAFLASSSETHIVLDKGTAGIPWEILDDGGGGDAGELPWAIRSKLLRKFKTEEFRRQVKDANSGAPILVIGEPDCPPNFPPLPGAYKEAKAVADCLESAVPIVASRIDRVMADSEKGQRPVARTVVNALLSDHWRVVHVAGHGALPTDDGSPGGVVLSDETFLGPQEIEAMRIVPELVFINCCHLGAFPAKAMLYDRVDFASGVARKLIDIGVRCVIAAGWAVDDGAAEEFATTFYKSLLRGERFIEAVARARVAAHKFDGNTWAAYQCYGDPDWKLLQDNGDWKTSSAPHENEFDVIATIAALKLALRTLTVESTYQMRYEPAVQLQRLERLKVRWLKMAWPVGKGIGELFAEAHAAAGDLPGAIAWYDLVLGSATGDASIQAFEQRSNLRVRDAWAGVQSAQRALDELKSTAGRTTRGRELTRRRAQAAAVLRKAIVRARRTINAEDRSLSMLRTFGDTAERASLRAAAMKRLAMVEEAAGRARGERAAIVKMKKHYENAAELARSAHSVDLFYALTNIIVARLALGERVDKKLIAEARESLAAKEAAGADFWSMADHTNVNLYEAMATGQLSKRRTRITAGYEDLEKRVGAGSKWASVYSTAAFVLTRYAKQRATSKKKVDAAEAKAANGLIDRLRQLVDKRAAA